MTTAKKDIIDTWKSLANNNKKIRELTKENRALEKKLNLHFRSRNAWRTIKKKKN